MLIELMVAPAEKWVPALCKLESVDDEGPLFFFEAIDRLGSGGDDLEILNLLVDYNFGTTEPRVLEAWLRLHERGVRFPENVPYPDMAVLLTQWGSTGMPVSRPDLVKRARAAAAELGFELPGSESRPRPPDRLR